MTQYLGVVLLELKPNHLARWGGLALYGFGGILCGGAVFIAVLGAGEFLLEESIPHEIRGLLLPLLAGVSGIASFIYVLVAYRRRMMGFVRFTTEGLDWSLPGDTGRLAYDQIAGIDMKMKASLDPKEVVVRGETGPGLRLTESFAVWKEFIPALGQYAVPSVVERLRRKLEAGEQVTLRDGGGDRMTRKSVGVVLVVIGVVTFVTLVLYGISSRQWRGLKGAIVLGGLLVAWGIGLTRLAGRSSEGIIVSREGMTACGRRQIDAIRWDQVLSFSSDAAGLTVTGMTATDSVSLSVEAENYLAVEAYLRSRLGPVQDEAEGAADALD